MSDEKKEAARAMLAMDRDTLLVEKWESIVTKIEGEPAFIVRLRGRYNHTEMDADLKVALTALSGMKLVEGLIHGLITLMKGPEWRPVEGEGGKG